MAKTYDARTQRFRDAYFKKVPRNMRRALRQEYCEFFNCTVGTFHHKLTGGAKTATTEVETKWLEEADVLAIYKKRMPSTHA